MKVKDVMHKGATYVEPGTPVREIAKRMRDNDVGAVPVRTDGRLVESSRTGTLPAELSPRAPTYPK